MALSFAVPSISAIIVFPYTRQMIESRLNTKLNPALVILVWLIGLSGFLITVVGVYEAGNLYTQTLAAN